MEQTGWPTRQAERGTEHADDGKDRMNGGKELAGIRKDTQIGGHDRWALGQDRLTGRPNRPICEYDT
jgi:hypothetical protein